VVIDDLRIGLVELRSEERLGERHPDRVRETLAERAGGGLDAGGEVVFRVARGPAVELAELLAALQSEADQPAADKPAAEQPESAAESTPADQPPAEASEKDAALAEANEAATLAAISKRDDNLELLLDVELEVTLRFGERQMLLRDILELSPGAVVELDRKLQEPAELLTAGKVMARGEVVIVDGNYGSRVTEIVSPQHRMPSLGG